MKTARLISAVLLIITLLAISGCALPGLRLVSTTTNTPGGTLGPTPPPINPTFSSPTISTQTTTTSTVSDFSEVIAKVRPSVVAINTVTSGGFLGSQEAAGSGWVLDSSGLIVTNNHVVEGADTVSVTFEDGRNVSAETIRTDVVTDLAVIKINAPSLPRALPIGDSSKLRVGNWVIAIGNSLGEGISATKGIVSAMGVTVATDSETLYDLIQTDAAINPGNSGGPLINAAGEVVGINSIKVAQVGVEGMGYAISTQVAIPILNQLITAGYITRAWMGVGLYTVDQTAVRQLRLSINRGVLITQVSSGGPAAKAGIQRYDVITKIDGKDVAKLEDLVKAIRSYPVGQVVKITYWRGNSESTTDVTLGQAPSQ